jgi:hypothetical protein
MPGSYQGRRRGARTDDARIPQPPVDPLPVAGHLIAASAALLGGSLKLRLERRQLGKRRIWISLLLALAMGREIATVLVIAPALAHARPIAAAAIGTIAGSMLPLAVVSPMFPLAMFPLAMFPLAF